jgi:hypothetical protein
MYDVRYFILFYLLWVVIISLLFKIMGVNVEEDEYKFIPTLSYIIYVFRNSVGDLSAPKHDYWD